MKKKSLYALLGVVVLFVGYLIINWEDFLIGFREGFQDGYNSF